jgi:hypothetical protein
MTRARTGFALFATLALGGCRACKSDHPFVPYSIDFDSGLAPDAAAIPTAAPFVDARPAASASAVVAPPNAVRWTLDGVMLVAPEGKVFVAGLAGDFDGDGNADAMTLVRRAEQPDLGEVWVYRASPTGETAGVLAGAPPPSLLGPSCSPTERLIRIGSHAAMAELGALCGEQAASTPLRWIGIVSAQTTPRLVASLLVVDPPGAPTLTVDAEAPDFDNDGHDDLLLRVTLEGGDAPFEPGPRLSAVVRWLDRPAGMSREADEPEASIHAIAVTALSRAAKPKDAVSVPRLVQQARALYVALCAEGGTPRLTRVMGDHPIQCGASHALEELALAEVRAYATMGDPLRAVAALDSGRSFPATHTAARETEARGWIEKLAPPSLASTLRAVLAVPLSEHGGRTAAWGALAFEPSGKLLVRTPAGVARVDPVTGDESDANGVSPWRSAVLSPNLASRLVEVLDPCDGFALRASVTSASGGEPRSIPLPVAPRVGAKCEGGRGLPVKLLPVAWGALGLEFVAAGSPILVSPDLTRAVPIGQTLDQPMTLGSPRSPDGKTRVIATTSGILVLGSRPRLFRAKELEGAYGDLYDCAVSDDAVRVACVRGGSAFVGIWPGG